MRSKEEYMELLRSYFQNKAKAYGVVKMALFGSVVRGEQTCAVFSWSALHPYIW